jgi:phosphoglycerol transferase MdoB-like AlkP superfamily enzyme
VNRFFRTYPLLTLYRTVLLYVVLMLCRVIFTLYNSSIFGSIEWNEIGKLIYGGLRFDTISICYAFGVWIVLSLLPLHLREKRWYSKTLFWYYAVVGAFCVAVNIADAVYFRYTEKRFTAEEILFAGNSNSISLMFKFAFENLHLVTIGLALIALLVWGYRRKITPQWLCSRWSYYVVNTAVLCATIVLCIAGIRGGLSRMARPTAIPYSLKFATTSSKANIVLSNPFCIIRTIGSSTVSVPQYFDTQTLSEIYTPYHAPKAEKAFKARNVVIFVIESMSAENSAYLCSDLYADEGQKGYTPFLDSLMQSGYTFERCYANGKRSIQALPSVWGSIPSLVEPFVLMPESLGESRPLPALLRDKGYSTAFFCGSERGSMGFDAYAISAGFEQCISKEDYERAHGYGDFDGYWGIWDDKFLGFMGETIDTLTEPFLASVFTISSHHPFVVPDEWKSRLPKGKTLIQPCAAYLDGAIREFFEQNRDKEWFNSTVFAFVADHVSCEHYAERTNYSPGDFHIIGLLYTPDGTLQGSSSAPVSQIDFMPTLLGILGYDEPYFAYGRDVLDPQSRAITVVYDNGVYKAFTDSHIHIFTEGRVTEVYSIEDSTLKVNLIESEYDQSTENYIKAYIQQYYDHAERKSYVVPAHFSADNTLR